jgi:hypothetical protein
MGFTFMPTEKEIEIQGIKFTIRAGDAEDLDQIISSDLIGSSAHSQSIKERCLGYKKVIECVLGKGSYEKIFAKRRINVIDHVNLVAFLFTEMNSINKEQEGALLGKTEEPIVVNTTVVDAKVGPDDTVQ